MKRNATLVRIFVVVLLAALAAMPAFAARGSANFTRYVALGDSLTAGVVNGSVLFTHQKTSYPALIARQAGVVGFQQPLVSEPGIGPEFQLVSLSPLVIAPKALHNGTPINLTLPRPYNNLGIPGADAIHLTTLTGAQPPTSTATATAQFILRGLGTAADQALMLQPTFISVWIGSGDALNGLWAGSPAAMTPTAEFESAYVALLDRLVAGAPNAGMVTATIPSVANIPYATTIPPVIVNPATRQPVLGPDGNPIFMFADLGGGQLGLLPPGSRVMLGASPLMATGYGIPPQLAPSFPQLADAGKPLPDAVVLTPAELTEMAARTAELNAVITSAAAARNIPVLVIDELLDRFNAGVEYGGVRLSSAFLTGGVFGLDGYHLSDLGYGLLANEYIRLINQAYGSRIRTVSITEYFENNAPVEAAFDPQQPVIFSQEAWMALRSLMGIETEVVTEPVRRRAVGR